MTREQLEQCKDIPNKTAPILSGEARYTIGMLCAEVERAWEQITHLQKAYNAEVERRRAAELKTAAAAAVAPMAPKPFENERAEGFQRGNDRRSSQK